jgi:hypothetical protein
VHTHRHVQCPPCAVSSLHIIIIANIIIAMCSVLTAQHYIRTRLFVSV